MRFINILVEGPTEEVFIKEVLNPHLLDYDLFLVVVLLETKRTEEGKKHKGGAVSFGKISRDVKRLLNDGSVVAVTRMLDYYGLPDDFPEINKRLKGDCYQKVVLLENAFASKISNHQFIPYLSLHEFEALLFAEPDHIIDSFPETPEDIREDTRKKLWFIKEQYASPEEMNDGRTTHPSARLSILFPQYRKPVHGLIIAKNIGIPAIRTVCPHFNQWLTRLESL